jgi:fructose-1,6-bisphosphatase/inositol monophosphatase family enzyme
MRAGTPALRMRVYPSVSLFDRVTDLLAEVVAEEVVTRFGRLLPGDVEGKLSIGDPDDLVTIVDHAVERRLDSALKALLPGSLVVGEEAVHADPRRLEALSGPAPVWLVDPLDGTKNFARGHQAYGVMIALQHGPTTQAAWIALPALGETYVAVKEAGTFRNGQRVRVPATLQTPAAMRGAVYSGFMARDYADFAGQRLGPNRGAWGAAAFEYTAIVRGERDFVVYHRLLPWDHAPGALVLTEAGGRVEHLDGSTYDVRSCDQVTILGANAQVCAAVRERLAQR